MARRHAHDARCLFNQRTLIVSAMGDWEAEGGLNEWHVDIWTSTSNRVRLDGTVRLRRACRRDLPGRRLPRLRPRQLRRCTVPEYDLADTDDIARNPLAARSTNHTDRSSSGILFLSVAEWP